MQTTTMAAFHPASEGDFVFTTAGGKVVLRTTGDALNLWSLFVRWLEPSRHRAAGGSRRWFLVIAARLVESARQKTRLVSVQGRWWEQLKAGDTRVAQWLAATAPPLKIPPPLPPQTSLAMA